jgi:hypothetical protein
MVKDENVIIDDKFIALGSPKFDKVINTRREDCELPEEWQRMMKKPDGSRKKIVFYNTTISAAIINGNRQYLDKMKSVFENFRNRDDALLWWRPHPLNLSSCNSNPQRLLEEYKQITRDYRIAGFGIYDDSSDMNRAIACSDVYYGDFSSLVALYGITGKPMLSQNISLSSNEFEMKRKYKEGNTFNKRINVNDCFMNENEYFNINDLLDILNMPDFEERYDPISRNQNQLFQEANVNSDGTCGRAIYDYCKEAVLHQIKNMVYN